MPQDAVDAADALPDYLEKYLANREFDETDRAEEIEAFRTMRSQAETERDPDIRQFMHDTIIHHCKQEAMKLAYVLENYWLEEVRTERKRKREAPPPDLFIALEEVMANSADSTGYTKQYCSSRYPLRLPFNYEGRQEVHTIDPATSPRRLARAHYQFGVHTFYAGSAINRIIRLLEERYGLNFKQLEAARQRHMKGSR